MDTEKILAEMTTEEKAALVSGTNFMYTNEIPRLGIPSLCMSDGPHGLRKQKGSGDNGVSSSEPATAFPTAATVASGWNPDNAEKIGRAIAEECRHYGVHVLLGPGINIKRNPLCGRNFEYYSEDPLLAGIMGAAEVEGLQKNGVGATLKHFALNNSENFRFMGNSVASEKTIREIYLRAFEYIVRKSHPSAVMCAYNRINGTYCSENKWLLDTVLRDEWGFDGVVMTDWGAVRDRKLSLKAGLDLEMPGDTAVCRRAILDGIDDGSLDMKDLDRACTRILNWIDTYVRKPDTAPVDWSGHHGLAGEIAADCAVLMKNNGVLPLTGKEKIRAAGELFSKMRYQGAGSSMINPTEVTSPKEAFDKRGVRYDYSLSDCDTVLVFAGLTDDYESEGGDRENMKLPQNQLDLISSLEGSGKKIIVILFGGSPVELPFNDKVDAILNMYLPGQNGGEAVAELVFGEKSPSGKLSETWPLVYEDVPGNESFGKGFNEVYSEGCEVGYRYYDRHNIPVRYHFGHGLSYTEFEKSAWRNEGGEYVQTIKNIGKMYGGEVAQLYLEGELAGFKKVYLEPGEEAEIRIRPHVWENKECSDVYEIPPEEKDLPITLESRFDTLKKTFMGRILYNAVLSVPEKQKKAALKMPEGPERTNKLKGAEFLKKILDSNSLRSMSMSAGKSFPYHFAKGFMELSNGHIIKGIKSFMSPVKVPKLPWEENK